MPAVMKKILLSLGALFAGPVIVLLIDPFFGWSMTGGLMTMALVSIVTIHGIWRKPKPEDKPDRIWSFIRRSWCGEVELWKVFWVVGVGLTAILWGISYFGSEFNAPRIWWIVLVILLIPLQVWWVVSVWRCAGNTNKRLWSVLAKICAVVSGANSAYNYFMIVAYPFGF